ncbi:MAG: hypothetical protein U0931_29760 [Vulcanimicrobiota bacterium]
MHSRRRRAIALVLTLMATAFLLVLLSAFFAGNMSQTHTRTVDEKRLRAQQAALSGIEYARMRLELQPRWGLPGQGLSRSIQTAGLQVLESDQEVVGGKALFVCVGLLQDGVSHFQISMLAPGNAVTDIPGGSVSDASISGNRSGPYTSWGRSTLRAEDISINNLSSPPWWPTLLVGAGGSGMRSVAGSQCRLVVRGYCNGRTVLADCTLEHDTISNSVMACGGTMAIDQDLSSRWNLETTRVGKNQIESNGQMVLRGSGAGTPGVRFVGGGAANSSDQILVDRTNLGQITDLGDGRLNITLGNTVAINPGQARSFTGGVFRPEEGAAPLSNLSVAEVEQTMAARATRQVTLPGGQYRFTSDNTIETPSGSVSDSIIVGGQVVARIRKHQLIFSRGLQVTFDGSTAISSAVGGKPSVLIGYENSQSSTSWLPAQSEGTFLKVNQGNLDVDGAIAGQGGIMATGTGAQQGDIVMRGRSQMSAAPDAPVTLFAEKNIKVAPPDPTQTDFFSVDLAPLSSALKNYANAHTSSDPDFDPWTQGNAPIQSFTNLGVGRQNSLTQGSNNPVSDHSVNSDSIKTSAVDSSHLGAIKSSLAEKFPVLQGPSDDDIANLARANYDSIFQQMSSPRMSAGRYIRVREYLRELQKAFDDGQPLPAPADSQWSNLNLMNEDINDQLKAELSFFDRKAKEMQMGFRSLINNGENPQNNPISASLNERDSKWTGMMYARGSIWVQSGDSANKGSLDLRGGMIALQDLAVTNVKTFNSIYDPTYLKQLSEFRVGQKIGSKLRPEVLLFR